jgi:quinol monooxygenase YgiN
MCILATVLVRPGSGETVRAIALDTARKVTSSGTCVSYHVIQETADSSVVCWFERWRDQGALDEHLRSPEAAEFASRMSEHIQGEMAVRTFEAIW